MKCENCKKSPAVFTARKDKDATPIKLCAKCIVEYIKKGYLIVTL